MPAGADARAEEHSDNYTQAAGSQFRSVHGQWLAVQSETMSPEQLDPADDERRAKDCRPEHYTKRGKRLIPAGREAGQLRLNEVQLVHDLGEVVARLSGLLKGEALGVEIAHAALTGSRFASMFLLSGPFAALSFFDDRGLDCGGERSDQGGFCGRAEVQGVARLLSKYYSCHFYHLGGAAGRGLRGAVLIHGNVVCTVSWAR